MKRILIILFLVSAFNLLGKAQKVKPVEYGGSINLIQIVDNKAMILKLRVTGFGKKDAQAQEDAEIRAIRAVMYAGVGRLRPLLVESKAEATHGELLNNFFDNKQYKDYITSSEPAGGLTKVKGLKVKKQPYDITVNVRALELFLTRNDIKGRMGF